MLTVYGFYIVECLQQRIVVCVCLRELHRVEQLPRFLDVSGRNEHRRVGESLGEIRSGPCIRDAVAEKEKGKRSEKRR